MAYKKGQLVVDIKGSIKQNYSTKVNHSAYVIGDALHKLGDPNSLFNYRNVCYTHYLLIFYGSPLLSFPFYIPLYRSLYIVKASEGLTEDVRLRANLYKSVFLCLYLFILILLYLFILLNLGVGNSNCTPR